MSRISLIVIVAFAIAVCLFFKDVIIGDHVLLTCNPDRWDPWRAYASGEDLARRTYRTDSARTYLPRLVEINRALGQGRLAFWNPYIFMGYPIFADPQARVLYPVSLLLGLVDPEDALSLDVAIHFLIALVGMYLFLGSVGASTTGAILGGFLFAFSSFFFTRMGHPTFVATASWIPWQFFAFRQGGGKGRLLLILTLALGYLAGFPQVFVLGAGALLFYALWSGVEDYVGGLKSSLASNLKLVVLSGCIAILLVSPQFLAFLEFLGNSRGLGIDFATMKTSFISSPYLLLRTIVPNLFGNPVEGTSWIRLLNPNFHPYNPGFFVYVGVGGLVAAVAGLAFLRLSREVRVFWALLVMTVALATSSKFLKPFYLVFPVLRFSQIDRISVIACFSLSALAGISFSLINKVSAHCRKRFVLILIGLVCAVLIGYVVLTLNHASIMAGIEEQARRLGNEFWQSPASREIARWLNSGDSQWLGLELGSIKLSLVMLLACVALLAGYALQRRRRTFTWAVAIIFVGLAIGDLLSTARSYYVSQPSGSLDETQSISLLKAAVRDEAGWRIGHFSDADNTFPTNVNEIFEIPSISGRSTLVPEGFARFAIAERQIKDLEVVDEPLRSSLRLQNIASVRYLVGDTLYPQMLRSPILAKLATLGSEPEMVSLDGERMLAFELDPGKPTRLDVWLLDIDRLDWVLGVEGDDSVYVGISLSNLRTLSVVKGLAGGCWQRFSIDISKLASGYCTLEIGVTPRGRAPVRCYLAQADLVVGDCTVEPFEGGYTIGRLKPEETLVLDVVSQKPLVRLNLDLGRDRFTRYLTFPAGTTRRQLALQLGEDQAELKVSGDGDFEIVDARMVRISQACKPQFEILSTRDMVILENTAAVRKGILIPDSVTRMVFKRRPLLEWDIASTLAEPGSCDLIDYRPEYIEAQIGCPEAGYFIIQDVYYPGWKAYLDGRRVDIVETIGGMRAVRVEKGEHRLVMKYQPSTLKLGIGLMILGLVLGTFYVRKSS